MENLIFIFSMPRSGSTLLQKILTSHSKIVSTGEPSILLPIFFSFRERGIVSIYGHKKNFGGVKEIIEEIDFDAIKKKFIMNIYMQISQKLSKDAVYFLDKTPRYWLIINEIIQLFPEAKFIFLFRNPLSVLASSIETWSNDELILSSYYFELIEASKKLVEGYYLAAEKNNLYKVKYEDIVTNPLETIKNICGYLNLEFEEQMLYNWRNVRLKGNFGDPRGINKYNNITNKTLSKWKDVVKKSIIRKKLFIKFINEINPGYFEIGNYNKVKILNDLRSIKNKLDFKRIAKDFFYSNISFLYTKTGVRACRKLYLHDKYNYKFYE